MNARSLPPSIDDQKLKLFGNRMFNTKSQLTKLVVLAMVGLQQFFNSSTMLAQEKQESLEQLIQQLGSSEFEDRERAANRLLQLGTDALEALKNVSSKSSKEIVTRSAVIVRVIEQRNLTSVSRQFFADVDDTNSHGLPGWSAFREICGSTRFSKMLFFELVKQQTQLASKIEEISQMRKRNLDTRDQEIQLSRFVEFQADQFKMKMRSLTGPPVEIGDVLGVMLAVSVVNDQAPIESSELILSSAQMGFSGYLNRPGFKPCLLQLMSAWVPKTPEAIADEVMGISNFLNISSVLPIARRHLTKGFDSLSRAQAILCIHKFGNQQDVAALAKLAGDSAVIHKFIDIADEENGITESFGAPPGAKPSATVPATTQMVVRINDLATAVAMNLANENPKTIFPKFTKDRFSLTWRKMVAVPESETESRDKAIRAWTDKQSGVESVLEPSLTPVPDPNP